MPATLPDFIVVRDRAFDEKLAAALKRHAIERERYVAARPAGPSDVQEDISIADEVRPETELLSLAQAGKMLGRSPQTLRAQVRNGRLNAVKLGHDWLVERSEIERYRTSSLGRPGRKPTL